MSEEYKRPEVVVRVDIEIIPDNRMPPVYIVRAAFPFSHAKLHEYLPTMEMQLRSLFAEWARKTDQGEPAIRWQQL